MKNFIITIGLCVFVLGLGMNACKSGGSTKPEKSIHVVAGNADNSRNSLDWKGTYTGIVPCADCQGIFTQITLKENNTYSLKIDYQGKDGSAVSTDGTFAWFNGGNSITMSGLKEKSMPFAYKVGENKLIQLDLAGNVITGDLASDYVLTKVNDKLVEKKWKLIEINGVALSKMRTKPVEDPFIFFQVNGNRVYGNSGCNNFSGTYKTRDYVSLSFSGLASTRKMCLDMTVEDQMNQLFKSVDNYSLQDNILSLNREKNPLMRFALSE